MKCDWDIFGLFLKNINCRFFVFLFKIWTVKCDWDIFGLFFTELTLKDNLKLFVKYNGRLIGHFETETKTKFLSRSENLQLLYFNYLKIRRNKEIFIFTSLHFSVAKQHNKQTNQATKQTDVKIKRKKTFHLGFDFPKIWFREERLLHKHEYWKINRKKRRKIFFLYLKNLMF